VTVALLVIYSVYAFLINRSKIPGSCLRERHFRSGGLWHSDASAVVAIPVYLLTAGFIAKLGHQSMRAWSRFFDFQFGVSESSRLTSALLAVLSCICCFLAYSHFRRAQARRLAAPPR
jgi:hypothetical protein